MKLIIRLWMRREDNEYMIGEEIKKALEELYPNGDIPSLWHLWDLNEKLYDNIMKSCRKESKCFTEYINPLGFYCKDYDRFYTNVPEISKALRSMFPDGKIESISALNSESPELYSKIRKNAIDRCTSDIICLKCFGLEYTLQEGTKEYVEDNIHKYVYDDKYLCMYSKDPFYLMIKEMFEDEEDMNKYLESFGYQIVKANSGLKKKHRLYITPYGVKYPVLTRGREKLNSFAFNDTVFLPSTKDKYVEINEMAHSIGLHMTEFIHACNFDRRNANGRIEPRYGEPYNAESMRGICKLYAPAGQFSFNTKHVVTKVETMVKDSNMEDKMVGKNILKELQELIKKEYADDSMTVFLGKNSQIYELAEELVHISRVETIVLLLHLGFNVYYETEDGAKYMEGKKDILEAILREEGLLTKFVAKNIHKESMQGELPLKETSLRYKDIFGDRAYLECLSKFFKFARRSYPADIKRIKKDLLKLANLNMNKHTRVLELNLATPLADVFYERCKETELCFDIFLTMFSHNIMLTGSLSDFNKFGIDVEIYNLKETIEKGIYRIDIVYLGLICLSPKSDRYKKIYKNIYALHKKSLHPSLRKLEKIKSEPKKSTTVVDGWVRNPKLVKAMKEFYDYKCQLCGGDNVEIPLIISTNSKGTDISYVEVHHIRELSASLDASEGTDTEVDTADNALVVCSYHHTYLHKQSRGLNKLVKKGKDVFITNEDGNESIKITTNKHLLIED